MKLNRFSLTGFWRWLELRALIVWLIQEAADCRESKRFDLLRRRERQLNRLERLAHRANPWRAA